MSSSLHARKISAWRHCYQGTSLDPLQKHQNLWPSEKLLDQEIQRSPRLHQFHHFSTWKMREESQRGSWSSFVAAPFDIFSEIGMHKITPPDHGAQIASLGLPCLGK